MKLSNWLPKFVKRINWKDPKYVLPAILYPFILPTGYCLIDLFNTRRAEFDNHLVVTDHLNPSLPEA